jgi:hypothetical protein
LTARLSADIAKRRNTSGAHQIRSSILSCVLSSTRHGNRSTCKLLRCHRRHSVPSDLESQGIAAHMHSHTLRNDNSLATAQAHNTRLNAHSVVTFLITMHTQPQPRTPQIPLPCTFRTSRPLDQGESIGARQGSPKDLHRHPPSSCTQPRCLSKTTKPTTSRYIPNPWSMFPPKETLHSQGLF